MRISLFALALICCGLLVHDGSGQAKKPKTPPPEKKDDKTKEPKEKTDKEFTDAKPEPEAIPNAYVRLLISDDNPLVRKRLVMALKNLGKDAQPALPVLFLLAEESKDDEALRKALKATIDNFTALEIIETLSTTVRDKEADGAQRRVCCKALFNYYFNPSVDDAKKKGVYQTLEVGLAGADGEVRVAAATMLESIDRKGSGSPRVVRIVLETDNMRRFKVTAKDVVNALEKATPRAQVQLFEKQSIVFWMPPDAADTTLVSDLGRVPVTVGREDVIVLRDIATFSEHQRPDPKK